MVAGNNDMMCSNNVQQLRILLVAQYRIIK